ncbi:MAG: flagellar biosynthesis anti-sigma factor FlgM [Planctomycetes bacterium]|nr:flagellar biosynthesis anti-sigma factor FlgM [Planctomycetota bacterium]
MIQATAPPSVNESRPTPRSDTANRVAGKAAAELSNDRIELSTAAQEWNRQEDTPIRTDLVQRVRAEISAGTYLTDDKLNVVIDRLHRDLFGS